VQADVDYCIISGGIIGLATALALTDRERGAKVTLLEKESGLAKHQTGHMVHDFLFVQSEHMLHVCTAPLPAATSAIPIGKMIVDRLLQ